MNEETSGFENFNTQAAGVNQSQQKKRDPSQFEYFNLKVGQSARIRVLDQKIFNMYQHTKKEEGKKRFISLRCTSTSEATGGRCVGCFYSDKDSGAATLLSTRKLTVLTIWDYRKVHKLATDTKKIEVRPCTGARCTLCKNGLEPEVIGKRHWSVGSGHFSLIANANLKIGDTCLNCKDGKISIQELVCRGCGESIFTDEEMGAMDDNQLKEQLSKRFECPSCGQSGTPEEHVVCDSCNEPKRASIYSTDLEVEKVASSDGSGFPSLQITPTFKFEELTPEMDSVEPYDFAGKVFPLLSLDAQAAIYGVKNPFKVDSDIAEEEDRNEELLKD